VSTDQAIAFTRKLVAAHPKDKGNAAPVELLVGAVKGHSTIPHAHELAAEWMARQFEK